MKGNINRAVSLTTYLVGLPRSHYLVGAMIALGFLFGLIMHFGDYGPIDLLRNAAIDGLMLLTLPALLSSFIVKLMLRRMPYRRIAATALAGELVYALAYLSSLLLAGSGGFLAQLSMMIGAALVFLLWYVIARFVFILKYRSILFAMLSLLFYLVFLVSNQALYADQGPFLEVAARFYASAFALLIALVIFFFIINAPMKSNLGVSSTDAISYFFSQWLYHNKDMEKAFMQVGEKARTIVSLMAFKRKSDTILFITPYVHFGPFGNLGGSEFSSLLAKDMDERHGSRSFVFHGTVTHDLNPVSSSEMSNITEALDSSLKEAEYLRSDAAFSRGESEECFADCLHFNNDAFLGLSRAPALTEDINFGLGLALIGEAEKKARLAMVVDQHNAETGEITSFEPGSKVGYNYLEAVRAAISSKPERRPLQVGASFQSVSSPVVGNAGVKIALFSSLPEYALVLIDSNGITPEFRERLERELKAKGRALGRGIEAGIYTTDTHQTNMVRGVINPVKDEDEMVEAVLKGLEEAAADMQDARVFTDKRWIDIKVIGAKQSIELISTINSIVAVSKIILPLILIGGLLLLLAVATGLGA